MKLQIQFTSVEESKRLLKLGIPANSADCFYIDEHSRIFVAWVFGIESDPALIMNKKYIPCWSVGRLIEILSILYGNPISWIEWCKEQPPIETILAEIESGVSQNLLNFSKLEE